MRQNARDTDASGGRQMAFVLFGIAVLLLIVGLAQLADDGEGAHVDGRVVASDCRVEWVRDSSGAPKHKLETCDVRVEYVVPGGATNTLGVSYRHTPMEPLTNVPEKDAVVQVDVSREPHKLVPEGGSVAGMLVSWLGAVVCIVIGRSQLRRRDRAAT